MTKPEMADEIVREVGHVDILIANLAYPHTYAPAHEKTDTDLEYAMQRIMYPLHRLTRAVLPQMLERQRGKIVVVGSATSLRWAQSRILSAGLRRALSICGRPLQGKGKRWDRRSAWSDAVICPAFDAARRQPPACMGVRGPGPDHP
jgi:NAD(P)-dependent dehydrogenase (short-subunit alcohol dehydrogenase family)